MRIAIFINPARLTPELKATLESKELTRKYDIDYDLFILEHEEYEKTLNQLTAHEYNACLVGGGDGTVRTAAQFLVNHPQLPLVILPLGTFNVLAKSLNYPNDIDKLFEIIKNKKTKEIDVAMVNETIFVNHAWLGFYYYILRMRKKRRDLVGRSRLMKAIFNTFLMFKRLPSYEFNLSIDGNKTYHKTCLLFISNNESSSNLFNFGERPLLATGLLDVKILNCYTRWQLFICILSMLFGKFDDSIFVTHFQVPELVVSSTKNPVKIVLDGELFVFDNPLHFKNLKNKLTVITI